MTCFVSFAVVEHSAFKTRVNERCESKTRDTCSLSSSQVWMVQTGKCSLDSTGIQDKTALVAVVALTPPLDTFSHWKKNSKAMDVGDWWP